NVVRQVRDHWVRRVAVVRGRCRQAGGGEQASRFEFRPSFAVTVRPLAGGLSWCELASIPVIIETFDETVHPSEAQRIENRVLVSDRLPPSVILVEHEPDAWTRRVVFA